MTPMDDSDNEVWNEPLFGMELSQEVDDVAPDITGDEAPREAVVVDESFASAGVPESQEENPLENPMETEEVLANQKLNASLYSMQRGSCLEVCPSS
jgi:hypothetical protein